MKNLLRKRECTQVIYKYQKMKAKTIIKTLKAKVTTKFIFRKIIRSEAL